MLKKIPVFIFILLPLLASASGKKTFYPASSIYFWIFVAVIFYIAYLFRTSKFPIAFLKSRFAITAVVSISILLLTYLSVNYFFKDPLVLKKVISYQPSIKELLAADSINAKNVEENYTRADVHINYIDGHFQIPLSWEGKYETETRDDFTIFNYYSFRLDQTDTLYLNMTRFALALFNIRQNKYDQAQLFLGDITDKNFPYLNYYSAVVNRMLHQDDKAVAFYKKAISLHDRYTNNAYAELISLLEARGDEQSLMQLLYHPEGQKYIKGKMAIKLFFKDNNVKAYYLKVLSVAFRKFKWTGFVAALAIMLVWLYYIVRLDFFEKERYAHLISILLTGMLSSLLCFYLYDFLEFNFDYTLEGSLIHKLFYSIFAIGLIEEFVKILPLLLLLLFNRKVVNEAYDYILYASLSALGFAFMENLLYFNGDLEGIIHGRAMTAVPGHMMFSSIVAYGFVLSRYRYKKFPVYFAFPLFLLLGCVSHGLYDYWLFIHSTLLFWFHFLATASIWIIIINNCMNNSPVFSYHMKFQTRSIQMYMAFSLLGILIIEYIIVAWENGPTYANRNFNSTLFLGGIFIIYYVDKLTNMDLVKGYWNTISLTTIEDKRQGEIFSFSSFFLRLISGDLVSHSFVNLKILLQCDSDNKELLKYFATTASAVISDRLIVTCKAKSNQKEYRDPYWFRLKTVGSLNVGGYTGDDFIFRFQNSRPSFRKAEVLSVYLYCIKTNPLAEQFKREDLRPLGRSRIRLQN